jgi:surface polysaccharide O-acyltransferase-like enzyme
MENLKEIKQPLLYPDLVRVIGICLIVLLHVAAGLFYSFSDKWTAGLLFDSPARVGVPLFFMLSGALLIPKQEPISIFMKKRFLKVIIPLIAWSIIYLVWMTFYHHREVHRWFTAILNGPVYFHLGFLYILITLYLATPIVRRFYYNSSRDLKLYFLLFCLLSSTILPTYTLLTGKPNPIGIDLHFFNGWIGYFVLGAFLAELGNSIFNNPKYRKFFLIIFLIGSASTALLTAWWSNKIGTPNEAFYEYLMPNVVLSAIGLFGYLQSFEARLNLSNTATRSGLSLISKTSFGIYLIHPIILELFASSLMPIPLTAQLGNPYLTIPLVALLCLGVSFGIIWVLQRIPVIRYCVP